MKNIKVITQIVVQKGKLTIDAKIVLKRNSSDPYTFIGIVLT